MGDFLSDLRYSLRMLIGSPAFTVTAVAALALGIGANTAIFTVVNAVLLKPLTYPEPDRMVRFMNTSPDGNGDSASPANFNTWRDQTSVFQDVTAYDFGGPGFNLTGVVPSRCTAFTPLKPTSASLARRSSSAAPSRCRRTPLTAATSLSSVTVFGSASSAAIPTSSAPPSR